MEFTVHAPLSRIPGISVVKEKHTKDLSQLTRVELNEIKEREWQLLSQKTRLNRLPDKGKRIEEFYAKVLAEIERRDSVDEVARLYSNLNIAANGKTALNHLEWNGRLKKESDIDSSANVLDSDDEFDIDPLRVLAQRTMHERQVKVLPPDTGTLITAADFAEIEDFKAEAAESACNGKSESVDDATVAAEIMDIDVSSKLQSIKASRKTTQAASPKHVDVDKNVPLEQHVLYLIEKTEAVLEVPQREKFKPYKTTTSNVHDPAKERARKMGKHWEVTAATPPLIQHNATQLLPLKDSVELQIDYLERLKALQRKNAEERLERVQVNATNLKISMPDAATVSSSKAFRQYRTSHDTDNVIEGNQHLNAKMEREEVQDPLDIEGGGVTYSFTE